MKTLLLSAALTALCLPAFAFDNDRQQARADASYGSSHYGMDASIAENQRANAAARGNVCLTRGGTDARYEGSADTCKAGSLAMEDRQAYYRPH